MTRRYTLVLIALDEVVATFGNPGVVRLVMPADVWADDGRPTTVEVSVDMGGRHPAPFTSAA